jgi:hypothetical protein
MHMTGNSRPPFLARARAATRFGLALSLLLVSLASGCADYCPPDSEDFFCRYVVSVRPPESIQQDLSDRPESLRSDPRYPN